jgi:hypothetical protein
MTDRLRAVFVYRIAKPAICLDIAARQAQLWPGRSDRRSVVNRNILNSKGVHVGIVARNEIFGLKGQKLYNLKGSNIYKLNGDLVGLLGVLMTAKPLPHLHIGHCRICTRAQMPGPLYLDEPTSLV